MGIGTGLGVGISQAFEAHFVEKRMVSSGIF